MKLRNLVAAFALIATGNSHAATGVFESYGIIKINASTNTYYDLQASTGNPDFQGANLGSFNPGIGNTLTLVGGELKSFKNGGSDVTGGRFDYRIYLVGNTPGAFTEFNLNYNSELGGGDQKWDNTGANVNVLAGLPNGNYALEVFSYSTTNEGNKFSNNGGANYVANFTVVPEPAAAVLGLLGTTLLLRRRK